MRLEGVGDGMVAEQAAEPDGLVAEVAPHQVLALEGAVSLVEHQVEDLEHRVEVAGEPAGWRHLEAQRRLLQALLGPHQALSHRALADEEGARQLGDAEAPDRLEGEGDLAVAGKRGMAAGEDHAQLVVAHLGGEAPDVVGVEIGDSQQRLPDRSLLLPPHTLASQAVQRAILGHLNDPSVR